MLIAPDSTTFADVAMLMSGLLAAAFLASWLATDVRHLPRRVYIALLAIVTGTATVVVIEVTGTSLSRIVGHHWVAGLLGGAITGVVAGMGLRRAEPTAPRRLQMAPPSDIAWEGALYGLAEGVLLSGLPVFVTWQAAAGRGWGTAWAWTASLTASVVTIAVHHFGYWDFRGPRVGLAIVGCGVLSVAYLVTGSMLAPAVGHVIMHAVGITSGVELPPHVRPQAAPAPVARWLSKPFRPRTA
jgi:hypothetical protein